MAAICGRAASRSGWKPTEDLQTYLVWEHFSEDDDRLRSAKQLCKTDYGPGWHAHNGVVVTRWRRKAVGSGLWSIPGDYFTQGCAPASLYSPNSFQAPLGYTLPYILGLQDEGNGNPIDPYASETQSHNLRVIDSGLNPTYSAKNDVVEFNADYTVTPALTFTSQTGFGHDFLFSAEDYNRFGAAPGLFVPVVATALCRIPTVFIFVPGERPLRLAPIGAPCRSGDEVAGGCTCGLFLRSAGGLFGSG